MDPIIATYIVKVTLRDTRGAVATDGEAVEQEPAVAPTRAAVETAIENALADNFGYHATARAERTDK